MSVQPSSSPRRLRRLYSEQDLDAIDFLSLSEEESRHALKSLRLSPGDRCLIVNGRGWEAEAVLKAVTHELAQFEIISSRKAERGFAVPVSVMPALIKKGKMDLLAEKAQEFGASVFQPLICDHSDFDIAADRFDAVAARWNKIAQEAAKQSGASQALEIRKPLRLDKALASTAHDALILIFHTHEPAQDWTEAARAWKQEGAAFSSVCVLIGPEGGFSQKEIQMALDCGRPYVKVLSIGNTVLRADTAFIAALAGTSFFL